MEFNKEQEFKLLRYNSMQKKIAKKRIKDILFFIVGTLFATVIVYLWINPGEDSLGHFFKSFVLGVTLSGVVSFIRVKIGEKYPPGHLPEHLLSPEEYHQFLIDYRQKQIDDAHYGGAYVVRDWGGVDVRNNTAASEDIIKILGTKYPLDMGSLNNEEQAKFQKKWHPDGHLYIGGGLFWDGQGHMITVGGTRSGKGTSLIVPALTSHFNCYKNAPSFVCLDPKGENLAISGRFLLESAGYTVVVINPFCIPEIEKFGNYRFNPFDLFTLNSPDFNQYVDMIRYAIIPPTKTAHANSFFSEGAGEILSLYISHMMTQHEYPKNIQTLYKWLRLAGESRAKLLLDMARNTHFDISHDAKAIMQQLGEGSKSVNDIYANVAVATGIFKDQQLIASMEKSDFNIVDIAKKKTAIFICASPSDLERNPAWLRLVFSSLLRSLSKNYSKTRKVVMIMDEFPTMGYFREAEIFSGYGAGIGAGITLWPIMQDLTQLKNIYPQSWETFVNNATIRHFVSIGDNFTADYLSKRMPQITKGDGIDKRREALFRPDEIMTNPHIISLINGVNKPALFLKKPYWEMPFCRTHTDPNPFRNQ